MALTSGRCKSYLCPAALLAINTSLLQDEFRTSRVPGSEDEDPLCSSCISELHLLGPEGRKSYRLLCSTQLFCACLCCGLPLLSVAHLVQRRQLREKYALDPSSSGWADNPVGALCCLPCGALDTRKLIATSLRRLPSRQSTPPRTPRVSLSHQNSGTLTPPRVVAGPLRAPPQAAVAAPDFPRPPPRRKGRRKIRVTARNMSFIQESDETSELDEEACSTSSRPLSPVASTNTSQEQCDQPPPPQQYCLYPPSAISGSRTGGGGSSSGAGDAGLGLSGGGRVVSFRKHIFFRAVLPEITPCGTAEDSSVPPTASAVRHISVGGEAGSPSSWRSLSSVPVTPEATGAADQQQQQHHLVGSSCLPADVAGAAAGRMPAMPDGGLLRPAASCGGPSLPLASPSPVVAPERPLVVQDIEVCVVRSIDSLPTFSDSDSPVMEAALRAAVEEQRRHRSEAASQRSSQCDASPSRGSGDVMDALCATLQAAQGSNDRGNLATPPRHNSLPASSSAAASSSFNHLPASSSAAANSGFHHLLDASAVTHSGLNSLPAWWTAGPPSSSSSPPDSAMTAVSPGTRHGFIDSHSAAATSIQPQYRGERRRVGALDPLATTVTPCNPLHALDHSAAVAPGSLGTALAHPGVPRRVSALDRDAAMLYNARCASQDVKAGHFDASAGPHSDLDPVLAFEAALGCYNPDLGHHSPERDAAFASPLLGVHDASLTGATPSFKHTGGGNSNNAQAAASSLPSSMHSSGGTGAGALQGAALGGDGALRASLSADRCSSGWVAHVGSAESAISSTSGLGSVGRHPVSWGSTCTSGAAGGSVSALASGVLSSGPSETIDAAAASPAAAPLLTPAAAAGVQLPPRHADRTLAEKAHRLSAEPQDDTAAAGPRPQWEASPGIEAVGSGVIGCIDAELVI